jgi:uncharacterized RDD family membrane protein YckC
MSAATVTAGASRDAGLEDRDRDAGTARAPAAAPQRGRAAEPGRQPDYAGLVTRALAFGIDAVAVSLVAMSVAAIVAMALSLLNVPSKTGDVLKVIGGAAFLIWTIAYFVTFWSTTGQTPGNRLMRIRVVPASGSPQLTPRRGVLRLAAMTLCAIPLFAGFLTVLVDDQRRGVHDVIARTRVVYVVDDVEHGPLSTVGVG